MNRHAALIRNLKERPPMRDLFGVAGRRWLIVVALWWFCDKSLALPCLTFRRSRIRLAAKGQWLRRQARSLVASLGERARNV